jgi:UDP-N-acetylmuramoylalanine--D-glutamate ligase
MREAFSSALKNSASGGIILLSPGAASFGVFKNEFDRGDQYVKLVKKLK